MLSVKIFHDLADRKWTSKHTCTHNTHTHSLTHAHTHTCTRAHMHTCTHTLDIMFAQWNLWILVTVCQLLTVSKERFKPQYLWNNVSFVSSQLCVCDGKIVPMSSILLSLVVRVWQRSNCSQTTCLCCSREHLTECQQRCLLTSGTHCSIATCIVH